MTTTPELQACTPRPLNSDGFNRAAQLPYGLAVDHIRSTMVEFLDFLGFINIQLHSRGLQRFESLLMPAHFSGIVGEFMSATIPKHCAVMVKNRYPNGHPDLLPAGMFTNDAVQHATDGVEIKASRYNRGWQGHNPEDVWLLVFVFSSNRPTDTSPMPFRFVKVVGAQLTSKDWAFSGRSATSRRTITASVTEAGYQKMMANWIYRT